MPCSQIDFAFLDSGTGGIPYMLALKEKSPSSSCVYLGDTAHFPYGEKSIQQIIDSSTQAVGLIISHWSPRTIVIACNTISVTALDALRKTFSDVPIVGTVPAIKLAAKVTRNKRIGFLATNAAVNHPYSARLVNDFASDCIVVSRGDPDLIEFIEHDLFTATEQQKLDAVKPAVDFFVNQGCDTIILGCTHFTHIARYIKEAAGTGVTIVDSREGVANQALRVEHQKSVQDSAPDSKGCPLDLSFFATAATPSQENEYKTLCANLGVKWGGVIHS